MKGKKLIIGIGGVVILAGIVAANVSFQGNSALSVTTETIARRNLEAVVTASGTIEPKSSVDISAETMGKVVRVSVNEGDVVRAGQPLLQIDPRTLETQLQNRTASLAAAESQLAQTLAQIDNSRVSLTQAEDTLRRQQSMWEAGLLAREQYERAVNDVSMRRTDLRSMEQSVETQRERIKQEEANLDSAQHDLTKVRVVSPIDGIVTRRNIEEGETAVVGTMNNAGTVLMTIADLSVIETEIEVDETDIPYIEIGQSATVTIDALPNRTFTGKVTEVGNSPIQAAGAAASATNFRVVITIDGAVPGVRPGFTCTAIVTTATREQATAVPIQSLTVREFEVDTEGSIVRPEAPARGGRARPISPPSEDDLPPGHEIKEVEGVFVVRDDLAQFQPVTIGIAGERYFEVLSGLQPDDVVITGPFASVRNLREGEAVNITTTSTTTER